MSKAVKQLISNDYASRLGGVEDGMLISIRGLKGIATTKFRGTLGKKNIKVTVVRNALAKKVIGDGGLAPLASLLSGPNAVVTGGASVVEVARQIVEMLKEFPEIELRGAVLDGQLFEGKAGVEELSKFPTREEAVAKAVTLIVSPAKNLMAAVKGPGSTVASLIKSIEEKLEKGETIAKVG